MGRGVALTADDDVDGCMIATAAQIVSGAGSSPRIGALSPPHARDLDP
jgi:hypothetical protein